MIIKTYYLNFAKKIKGVLCEERKMKQKWVDGYPIKNLN